MSNSGKIRARTAHVRAVQEKAVRHVAAILGRGHQGEELARALVERGIKTRAALRKPKVLRMLPRDSQINVMYPPSKNTQIAEVDNLVEELLRRITFCPLTADAKSNECFRLPLYIVGSVRRRTPRVKDVDIVVHAPARLAPAAGRLLNSVRLADSRTHDRALILDAYLKGDRHQSYVVRWAPVDDSLGAKRPRPKFFHVDLFLAIGDELPFALFHRTGSKKYNIRIRAYAKRKNWLLNQYGLWERRSKRAVPGSRNLKTERDIANFLGITYREPADREQ